MTLQAALDDDVRLTDWPYDEEPLDLYVPEAIAFATRKMDVKPFFVTFSRDRLYRHVKDGVCVSTTLGGDHGRRLPRG
ncbi:hypothetical protein MRX96_056387 [Rhipicephalus microplus]